ncbi:MAG: hypothetical protein FE834_06740 [Gammaproteobacteria bacterium]|nr:hypothetical protein [Gammaproteobacteria bacterium]
MSFTKKDIQRSLDSSFATYIWSIPRAKALFYYTIDENHKIPESEKTSLKYAVNLCCSTVYQHLEKSSPIRDKIDKGTNLDIASYVKKYELEVRKIDNYKSIYFMGLNCIKTFDEGICVAFVRLMLLLSINDVFEEEDWENITQDMFQKFARTLSATGEDALDKYFGKYGLYFIFKTTSKISDARYEELSKSVPGR